jgi:hypothetical protein
MSEVEEKPVTSSLYIISVQLSTENGWTDFVESSKMAK